MCDDTASSRKGVQRIATGSRIGEKVDEEIIVNKFGSYTLHFALQVRSMTLKSWITVHTKI